MSTLETQPKKTTLDSEIQDGMIRLISGPASGVTVESGDSRFSRDGLSFWHPSSDGDLLYTRADAGFQEMFFAKVDTGGLAADKCIKSQPLSCDEIEFLEQADTWKCSLA